MLTRLLTGGAVAVGLVFGAATLAQPPGIPTPTVEDSIQPPSISEEPKDAPSPTPARDSEVSSPTPVPEALPPPREATPAPTTPPQDADPEKAVESFMERNRKEAQDAIKALTKERQELRSRLQKVESALARWQAVANALDGKREEPRRERVSKRPTIIESTKPTFIESVPLDVPPDISPAGVPVPRD